MEEQITPERIAKHYSACLDSVWVVNNAIANPEKYEGDDTVIERNVKHLEGMINAPFWTTENMTPITTAIAAGNAVLNQ